jgi:anti-sigma factor RsiW
MTCHELIDFIMAYRDGELPHMVRAAFERHLSLCRECREYLAQYEKTLELLHLCKDDPDFDPAAAVPEELLSAVIAARLAA